MGAEVILLEVCMTSTTPGCVLRRAASVSASISDAQQRQPVCSEILVPFVRECGRNVCISITAGNLLEGEMICICLTVVKSESELCVESTRSVLYPSLFKSQFC